MDFNNCSNNSESVIEYLRYLDEKSDRATIPAVVMLVMFSVVGLVGNILVLVVYSQKVRLNPSKVLIMTIASFDLVANIGAIPAIITTLFDTWNFSRPALCKLTVFLGSFTSVGGAMSLVIVSVIRYRKVCRPHGWQVTIRQAVIASVTCFLLAATFCTPYIILFGIWTRQTPCPNIRGSDCFVNDHYFSTIWPLLNNMLFIAIYLSISISMIVLYTFIGVTVWKHSKFHGVSTSTGETPSKITKCTSTSVLSSSVQIPTAPKEETPKAQPETTSTTHISSQECLNPHYCFTKHQTGEKTQKDTPFSSTMKSYVTKTTENEESNSESTNLKSTTTPNKNLQLQLPSTLEGTLKQFSNIPVISVTNHCLQLEPSFTASKSHRRQSKTREDTTHERETSLLEDISSDGDIHLRPDLQINKTNQGSNLNISSRTKEAASSPLDHFKKPRRRFPLGKMTAMLIIISAIFVVGFLPFFILTIYKNRLPEKYASLSQVEQGFFNLFYRMYFLNCAANPIVYSLCDINFRRHCIQLLTCKPSRYW